MNEEEILLKLLKERLADELAAVNRHSDMPNNCTYGNLIKTLEKNTLEEFHYASWLIQRIAFYDGIPALLKLGSIKLCETDPESVKNIQAAEMKELLAYRVNISPQKM